MDTRWRSSVAVGSNEPESLALLLLWSEERLPGLKGQTGRCFVSEASTVRSRGGSASYEEGLILLCFKTS